MKILKLIFASVLIMTALLAYGCKPPEVSLSPGTTVQNPLGRDLTVEEASSVIGLPVPVPGYLPPGYQITSVRLANPSQPPGPWWSITLTMDNGVPSETITLDVQGMAPGLKLPPGAETVMIGNSKAMVSRNAGRIRLFWLDFTLTGNGAVRFEELIRIAESVTATKTRVVEMGVNPDADLLVLRGESRDVAIHLQNNSVNKNVSVTITHDTGISDLPVGIGVTIKPSSFNIGPGQGQDVKVNVKVNTNAPSPEWKHQPASSILSTNPPPPVSGIWEEPSYYLQFQMVSTYNAGGITIRESNGFSKRLRVDQPSPLPAGMVSLKEAEDAANFPVALLLPSYFPEGVNPPPIGYGISATEPHSITAFYSSFRVELSPEPGILQPPESVPGERAIIRTKQVVIGPDRIDWWAYDIHFVVISDRIPMAELKLIAESMMLIGVYSGSWLGVGN